MKSLGKLAPKLNIFPVYSTLPSEMQTRIFDPTPPGERKVLWGQDVLEDLIERLGGFAQGASPCYPEPLLDAVSMSIYSHRFGEAGLVFAPKLTDFYRTPGVPT